MADSDDIVKEFLAESQENLDRLDRDLVELEKHPSDREILASIFRTIHTIKGTCGFLGFNKLEAVAHVGENLLARLRDGHLILNPVRTSALLAMVDAVREMLGSIESTGNEGERDDQKLLATLTELLEPDAASAGAASSGAATGGVSDVALPQKAKAEAKPEKKEETGKEEIKEELKEEKEETQEKIAPAVVPAIEAQAAEVEAEKPEAQNAAASSAATAEHAGEKSAEPESNRAPEGQHKQEVSQNTIRVSVSLLDQLMNLVGELVLARNQILQFTRNTEETSLVTTGQRLNLIATELQEGVMKTRMQPIGSVWSRFPRTVRDVAIACGKRVRIEMEGQETELDKTLIEAIKDPMTHLVRNAVDHGIERSEVRAAAGKDPEGVLRLRAYHEGGQVNIEIIDDGAGLDLKRIVHKAVQKGLIQADEGARLSDREAANLIFLPGLSTAEKITNVSGRGVGMDVVKTNIERIGGTADIQSSPGAGTTVKLKIPLTLAIVPALIVTAAGQRFAIPQASLLELVGLGVEETQQRIEIIQGAAVYRLRGNLLPLVELRAALRIAAPAVEEKSAGKNEGKSAGKSEGKSEEKNVPVPTHASDVTGSGLGEQRGAVNIVVLQADGNKFGLVVDEISDTEEIVVKPLGKHLKNLNVFAGATIMGDGKVALILDVLGLAQHAHVIDESRDRETAEASAGAARDALQAQQRRSVLLFRLADGARMAINLSAVARLEEFQAGSLEKAGRLETVQYRGQIMPLVRLSQSLNGQGMAAGGDASLQVIVVYAGDGRNVGLVVERILDIVDESFQIDHQTSRPGVIGSAVIQQRITEVVDVPGLLAAIPGMERKTIPPTLGRSAAVGA